MNKITPLLFFPLAARHRRGEIQRWGCGIASTFASPASPWTDLMTTCYAQPYAPAAEQKGPSLVGDQQPAGLYVHLLQNGFAPTAAGETACGFLSGRNFLLLRRRRKVQIFSICCRVNQFPPSRPGALQKMKFAQLELLFLKVWAELIFRVYVPAVCKSRF